MNYKQWLDQALALAEDYAQACAADGGSGLTPDQRDHDQRATGAALSSHLQSVVLLIDQAREQSAQLCDGIAKVSALTSTGLQMRGAIAAAESCGRLIRANK